MVVAGAGVVASECGQASGRTARMETTQRPDDEERTPGRRTPRDETRDPPAERGVPRPPTSKETDEAERQQQRELESGAENPG